MLWFCKNNLVPLHYKTKRNIIMKKDDKILLKYSSKEDLLTNNQILKVYFEMPSASLADLAEKILLQKYNRRNQEIMVKKAINKIRGTRSAEVDIPRFNYKEKVCDILSTFVHTRFGNIISQIRNGNNKYPTKLRDLVESFDRK